MANGLTSDSRVLSGSQFLQGQLNTALASLDDKIYQQADALSGIVDQQNILNTKQAFANASFEMGQRFLAENFDLGFEKLQAGFTNELLTLQQNLGTTDLKYDELLGKYAQEGGQLVESQDLGLRMLDAAEERALFNAESVRKQYESQYRLSGQGLNNLAAHEAALRERARVAKQGSAASDSFTSYNLGVARIALGYQQFSQAAAQAFAGGGVSGLFQGFNPFGVSAALQEAQTLGRYYQALGLEQARRSSIDANLAVSLENVRGRRRLLNIQRDALSKTWDPRDTKKRRELIRQDFALRREKLELQGSQAKDVLARQKAVAERGRAQDRLGIALQKSYAITKNIIAQAEQYSGYRQTREAAAAKYKYGNQLRSIQQAGITRRRKAAERALERSKNLRKEVAGISVQRLLSQAEDRRA